MAMARCCALQGEVAVNSPGDRLCCLGKLMFTGKRFFFFLQTASTDLVLVIINVVDMCKTVYTHTHTHTHMEGVLEGDDVS